MLHLGWSKSKAYPGPKAAVLWVFAGLQVTQDITDECNKYGTVLRVVVPRPADVSQVPEVRYRAAWER